MGRKSMSLPSATIGEPMTLFENEAGRIIFGLGRSSMVDHIRNFSSLKHFIFGIPGKKNERLT
jgi:hypothetical protein